MSRLAREDGIAVLVAMMAILIMTAFGTALILSSSSETTIAGHFVNALEGGYAADAMLARGLDDLLGMDDWNPVIAGVLQSRWVDGPPTGARTLADGSRIDLSQVVNMANCQKGSACSPADIVEATSDRPWGANNPEWKVYAHGPLPAVMAGANVDSRFYVLLLVGQGPAPNLLALRAEAFGPRGAHAIVEATAARTSSANNERDYNGPPVQNVVKLLSWREVR
jgi:hypothetical protein